MELPCFRSKVGTLQSYTQFDEIITPGSQSKCESREKHPDGVLSDVDERGRVNQRTVSVHRILQLFHPPTQSTLIREPVGYTAQPFDAHCCHNMGTAIKHPVRARPG